MIRLTNSVSKYVLGVCPYQFNQGDFNSQLKDVTLCFEDVARPKISDKWCEIIYSFVYLPFTPREFKHLYLNKGTMSYIVITFSPC